MRAYVISHSVLVGGSRAASDGSVGGGKGGWCGCRCRRIYHGLRDLISDPVIAVGGVNVFGGVPPYTFGLRFDSMPNQSTHQPIHGRTDPQEMYESAVERGTKKAQSPVLRTFILAFQAGLQVTYWIDPLTSHGRCRCCCHCLAFRC